MRWYIIKTLLHKELLRHLANRRGIFLIALILAAALLLSLFGKGEDQTVSVMGGGTKVCYIDYVEWNDWLEHLYANQPPELDERIIFRQIDGAPKKEDGQIMYRPNTGGIQITPGNESQRIDVWHPGKDASTMAPYEAWFWRETRNYQQKQAGNTGVQVEQERHAIAGGVDPRSGIATALVWFGLFFVCVYLMPSITAEEREKGVLLAQALSPATAREILGAKFLFYPVVALIVAVVIAGTYNPSVLVSPFFWLSMVVAVAGVMGIGLTLASVAKTQRAASMGAMCYLFAVALIMFICEQVGLRALPYLALEFHCPRMIHASLGDAVLPYHWGNLAAAAGLTVVWAGVATYLFRRFGWQS